MEEGAPSLERERKTATGGWRTQTSESFQAALNNCPFVLGSHPYKWPTTEKVRDQLCEPVMPTASWEMEKGCTRGYQIKDSELFLWLVLLFFMILAQKASDTNWKKCSKNWESGWWEEHKANGGGPRGDEDDRGLFLFSSLPVLELPYLIEPHAFFSGGLSFVLVSSYFFCDIAFLFLRHRLTSSVVLLLLLL